MATCGSNMKMAGQNAVSAVKEENPDFVTGHSLGGFLSEIAFSYKPTTAGASFGAPGPYSTKNGKECSFLDGDQGKEAKSTPYSGKKFNVVINHKDQLAREFDDLLIPGFNHISNSPIYIDVGDCGGDVKCPAGHNTKIYVEATTGAPGLKTFKPDVLAQTNFDGKKYSDGALKCE